MSLLLATLVAVGPGCTSTPTPATSGTSGADIDGPAVTVDVLPTFEGSGAVSTASDDPAPPKASDAAKSAEAAMDCAASQGVHLVIDVTDGGQPTVGASGLSRLDDALSIADECLRTHFPGGPRLNVTSALIGQLLGHLTAEDDAAYEEALLRCLEDAGIVVDRTSPESVEASLAAAQEHDPETLYACLGAAGSTLPAPAMSDFGLP